MFIMVKRKRVDRKGEEVDLRAQLEKRRASSINRT